MQADRDLSFGNFHALTPKSCRVFYVNSSSCRTRYSITQQQGQHRRVLQRLTEIRFYQPDIVGHARCGGIRWVAVVRQQPHFLAAEIFTLQLEVVVSRIAVRRPLQHAVGHPQAGIAGEAVAGVAECAKSCNCSFVVLDRAVRITQIIIGNTQASKMRCFRM